MDGYHPCVAKDEATDDAKFKELNEPNEVLIVVGMIRVRPLISSMQ